MEAIRLRTGSVSFDNAACGGWSIILIGYYPRQSSLSASGQTGPRPDLAGSGHPRSALADAACRMILGPARRERYPGYACTLTHASVTWLVLAACRRTLVTNRQSASAELRAWLDKELARPVHRKLIDTAVLAKAVKNAVGIS